VIAMIDAPARLPTGRELAVVSLLGAKAVGAASRSRIEPGRCVLTVVRAPVGGRIDEVTAALVRRGMPFVHVRVAEPIVGDHWGQWHRGPVIVVLLDPVPEDWDLAATLDAPVVVVQCGTTDTTAAVDALLHGAHALLWLQNIAEDLPPVLSLVARGYRALDPAPGRLLATWVAALIDGPAGGTPELTDREHDILASIARGHTVRQSARALGIATKTVENTQARLFRKLGTHNRSETLTVAYRLGLVGR
jgi:DNA-binding CsgD family transcriptional regulator